MCNFVWLKVLTQYPIMKNLTLTLLLLFPLAVTQATALDINTPTTTTLMQQEPAGDKTSDTKPAKKKKLRIKKKRMDTPRSF